MVDLSTNYLGLKIRTPLVPSACPLTQEIDRIRQLEDAGASAVVLNSLFEEQLNESAGSAGASDGTNNLAAHSGRFRKGPQDYLEHIRKAKQAVKIPVIASLNGTTPGGWTQYAREIQQAGADALECNIYWLPTDAELTSAKVEEAYLEIVQSVKAAVTIPVAVKLSPFFSNMANMAKRLDALGADGLVLFNRFFQPDIDLEKMEITPTVLLSTAEALRLPLTWIGILYGRVKANLAASSGIQTAEDAMKLLLAGADVTMLCSTLLRNGASHLRTIEQEMRAWMEERRYASIEQIRGTMSQLRCTDPAAFERAQYTQALKGIQHVVLTGREAWRILGGE